MKILMIKNSAACAPFLARTSAERCGFSVDEVAAYETDVSVLDPTAYAGVVVLGGVHDATDYEHFPYSRNVEGLIRRSLDNDVPLFAICLGAQQAAMVLGETVFRGENGFEGGWRQMQRTPAGVADPVLSVVPDDVVFMEWHQDTFDLPKGATLLASTDQYTNQIYRYGSMFAVQFHPELDEANIRLWHAHRMTIAPETTPSLDDLMHDVDKRTDAASRLMDAFWKETLNS